MIANQLVGSGRLLQNIAADKKLVVARADRVFAGRNRGDDHNHARKGAAASSGARDRVESKAEAARMTPRDERF